VPAREAEWRDPVSAVHLPAAAHPASPWLMQRRSAACAGVHACQAGSVSNIIKILRQFDILM